ncbi:MAG: helix-turn-helix domain-containing protein [Pseudomonadota bacterium]
MATETKTKANADVGAGVDADAGGNGNAAPTTSRRATAGLEFKEIKRRWVASFEREYLHALMGRHRGNVSQAAREAGLTRYHLRELLRRHRVLGEA